MTDDCSIFPRYPGVNGPKCVYPHRRADNHENIAHRAPIKRSRLFARLCWPMFYHLSFSRDSSEIAHLIAIGFAVFCSRRRLRPSPRSAPFVAICRVSSQTRIARKDRRDRRVAATTFASARDGQFVCREDKGGRWSTMVLFSPSLRCPSPNGGT